MKYLESYDKWVSYKDITRDIESKYKKPNMATEEEYNLQKDLETFIGKKIKDFDYSDKVKAYEFIENKNWIQDILKSNNMLVKKHARNFLDQLKDFLGI